MSRTDADIVAEVRRRFQPNLPERLAVAVSGGGDSVALLHILTRCFTPGTVQVMAATVDHGLRRGSADEAAGVARLAAGLGVPHRTLQWSGWDGRGNLQDQARRARYRLLTSWARAEGAAVLAVGHTADDQAETLLMRLARSSGVTGLAGIAERRVIDGVTVVRPLLDLTRAELREYLVRNGLSWVEDPSNDDTRFERIRMRQALEALAPLGLTVQALGAVARNMARARAALDWYAFLAARDMATVSAGDILFDHRQFRTLPDETARRLLIGAITWVSRAEYPPRSAPMRDLLDAARRGQAMTLGGCHIFVQGETLWVTREYKAVAQTFCAVGEIWDGRWRLTGGAGGGAEIRALGRAGLARCADARATGRPLPALIASPSVWRGSELLAAPLAGLDGDWTAEPIYGAEEFFASLLSH